MRDHRTEPDLSEFQVANIPPPERVDLADYPADTIGFLRPFCELWRIPPPRGKEKKGSPKADWISSARDGRDACKPFEPRFVLERVFVDWNRKLHMGDGYDVGRPGAVVNACRAMVGNLLREADGDEAYRGRYLTGSLHDD